MQAAWGTAQRSTPAAIGATWCALGPQRPTSLKRHRLQQSNSNNSHENIIDNSNAACAIHVSGPRHENIASL
jgi:hypothetical protein